MRRRRRSEDRQSEGHRSDAAETGLAPAGSGPVMAGCGHMAGPCNVRAGASKAHIGAVFASGQTSRSLCVGPLGSGACAYFDCLRRAVRDALLF
jgi:hypothetical protein